MDRTYAFIDGNYLEKRYEERMSAFFNDAGDLDYNELRQSGCIPDLKRAYYYNSINDHLREGETEAARTARVDRLNARFDEIDQIPEFHGQRGSVLQHPESPGP